MQIDRQRVRDAFDAYVDRYDRSDEKILLKIEHTTRVAALCEEIARSIGCTGQETELAWLCGMLHDIGRFEQLRQYGTFSDADSIDHAHYGVEILFDQKRLLDFVPNADGTKEAAILRTAIWNHSAYRIQEGLSKQEKMFCNILRDADKVDILKVNHDVPIEVIYNVSTEALQNDTVTSEVMEQFFEKHAVLRSVKRTSVDHIVGHISLVFELVYPRSLQIVREQGYLEKLLHFSSENPVTQKQFQDLRDCMEQWMDGHKFESF